MTNSDNPKARTPFPLALIPMMRDLGRLGRPKEPNETKVSSDFPGIVDWALYRNGVRHHDAESLHAACVEAHGDNESFVWVGLHQPTSEEFKLIADEFSLHPLAVEDAVHAHQRPKFDHYGESLFAVFKTARYVDKVEVIETGEVMLFLGKAFVISVRHDQANGLHDLRNELEASPEVLAIGPSAVLWAVADRIVDDYLQAIDGVEQDIEEIETAVFDPNIASPTERIYKLKREVLEFRRSVDPLLDALEQTVGHTNPLIDERTHPYFRDVHDHALRDASRLAAFDALLTDMLQANVAQMTLRQSEDMRKITAWAAILAVVTSIAGIYGMNFDNMPELRWANGYYLCLALIFGSSTTLYFIFRRRKWL